MNFAAIHEPRPKRQDTYYTRSAECQHYIKATQNAPEYVICLECVLPECVHVLMEDAKFMATAMGVRKSCPISHLPLR